MSKVPWYVLFGLSSLIFIVLAAYFYFSTVPENETNCKAGCALTFKKAPWLNGPECVSVEENHADATIPKPSQQPYLSAFDYVQNNGPPFCNPTWYAFRYVRNSDGAYGPLSDWSGTDPSKPEDIPAAIYACASSLPCVPSAKTGSSSGCPPTGKDSAAFNRPTIALAKPLDFDVKNGQESGYTLNVHRQVGYIDSNGKIKNFDPASEGDIVGSFYIFSKPINGLYANFPDNIFPPTSNPDVSYCC